MSSVPEAARRILEKVLNKPLYVIVTTAVASREEIEERLPEHLEHQIRLEQEGIMFGAGPLFTEQGKGGRGMIIVRAGSFEEAHAIADRDPFHKHGLRTYTVDRWQLNEGTVSIRINYSDGSYTID